VPLKEAKEKNMPREFLPLRRKRESKGEGKSIPRPPKDRMLRSSVNRTLRQCAAYEDKNWPTPDLEHVKD